MKKYAPLALRVGIGGLFLTMGLMKLMNPSMVIGMLQNMGFPGASVWAWIVIVSELLFEAAVIVGYRLKYTTIPLAIILLIAIATSSQMTNALKDVTLLSGLVSLWLSGPGNLALGK